MLHKGEVMQRLLDGIAALLVVAGLSASPGEAQTGANRSISKAAVDARCKVGLGKEEAGKAWSGGLHPSPSGLTPTALPGATRLTASEAACVMQEYGPDRFRLVTPISEAETIPHSHRIIGGGDGGSLDDTKQRDFERRIDEITKGDRSIPIIAYCHHVECFMSYNLVLRAKQAGYRNLYWLRSGVQGWKASGGVMWTPRDASKAEYARFEEDFAAKRAAETLKWPRLKIGEVHRLTVANTRRQEGGRGYWFERIFAGRKGERFRVSLKSTPGNVPWKLDLYSVAGRVEAKQISSTSDTKDATTLTSSAYIYEVMADGEQSLEIFQNGAKFHDTPGGGSQRAARRACALQRAGGAPLIIDGWRIDKAGPKYCA